MQTIEVFLNSTVSDPWNVSLLMENYTYHNNTNITDLQLRNQFILPWWRQMIWTLLFAGMIIVATGGNLIVIWIVMAHKRMRTVTNYFLVNLSIADAMVSTLNVTFNYVYMLNSHWPFGTLYCKICQFIAVLTICASVFTLMAISIDRIFGERFGEEKMKAAKLNPPRGEIYYASVQDGGALLSGFQPSTATSSPVLGK
ncbi:Tachykinin peptides receptor 99D [Apis cerana cerana]|uniref:Tachykinin peptides receptor 99D n=1 Tax=Apis cerana cerana TaxID=94128 RepID=A0A2A3E604_APICC|nr:Tachykinin peptides receptor 99D [Apis cerana cerana]